MEEVNNLLNLGEIPGLYSADEKEMLLGEIKEQTMKERLNLNQLQLWEYFINKCRRNLHVVVYLSPAGKLLQQRFRDFPSLVSCSNIIWMQSWSDEALNSVAKHYLKDNEEFSKIIDVFVKIHQSTI